MIRWLIKRDYDQTVDIDNIIFDKPITREILEKWNSHRQIISICMDEGDIIKGYIIYQLYKTGIEIKRIGVHPDFHRRGVGTALVKRLIEKLEYSKRNYVNTYVIYPLGFWKSLGFEYIGESMEWKSKCQK